MLRSGHSKTVSAVYPVHVTAGDHSGSSPVCLLSDCVQSNIKFSERTPPAENVKLISPVLCKCMHKY